MNTKLKYVDDWQKLAQESNWSVLKMAKKCGVSVRTLERYFIKNMGKSPKTWLLEQRQKQAVKYLRNGSSIKATAVDLGYKYGTHFSREFKEYWGFCATKLSRQLNLS